MNNPTKHLCSIPGCLSEAVEPSQYCTTHHREYEECDMVEAVSGPEVVGMFCQVCGAEKDYSDD